MNPTKVQCAFIGEELDKEKFCWLPADILPCPGDKIQLAKELYEITDLVWKFAGTEGVVRGGEAQYQAVYEVSLVIN